MTIDELVAYILDNLEELERNLVNYQDKVKTTVFEEPRARCQRRRNRNITPTRNINAPNASAA